jgi:purine-binding chemotaxis protein CheW
MSGGPIARRDAPQHAVARAAGRRDDRGARDGIHEFLGFVLGTGRMGLPLGSVREILKPGAMTPVPRAPHDVLGILSVRGRIITVIDLRRRLGLPTAAWTRLTRILLVDGGTEVMGVLVDAVLHVLRLRDDEIEQASAVAADMPDHVLGVGRPRRGRESRAKAATGEGREASAADDVDFVVLLDPVALLRR